MKEKMSKDKIMKTVKKNATLSRLIIVLMCVVFLWGFIASITASVTANGSKVVMSTDSWNDDYALDRDGKIMTTNQVGNERYPIWLYSHSRDSESISQVEWQRRIVKNRKHVRDNAKEVSNANKDDKDLKEWYDWTIADYKAEQNALSQMNSDAAMAGSNTFFGIYLPVLVFLGIMYVISKKSGGNKTEVRTEAIAEIGGTEPVATKAEARTDGKPACGVCGAVNGEGAAFCNGCGNALKK